MVGNNKSSKIFIYRIVDVYNYTILVTFPFAWQVCVFIATGISFPFHTVNKAIGTSGYKRGNNAT